jgi:TetR/AcrR family transcriptional regulator
MGISERKEREKEQRRLDILNAAEKVFFEKGTDNATMDDIAEHAELSKGTLYLYYKSKEELLFAISLRAMKILKSMFEKAIDPSKKTIDNIIEVGRVYVKFFREHSDYFKILLFFEGNEHFNPDHEMYALMCGHNDDPMSFFMEMLRKGMKDGSVRTDISPEILAHILWSQTAGILKLAKSKDYHLDMKNASEDEIINAHIKILLNGIKNES